MVVGPQETSLVPRGSRVLATAVIAVSAVTEASLVVYGHADLTIKTSPWVAVAAVGAYLIFWAPRLRLTPAELEVVNPLRTHHIPWPAISGIETQWSPTVVTSRGRVTLWAAPAPSPWSELGRLRRDPLGRASLEPENWRNAPGTLGALAPMLLIRHWESYRDASPPRVSDGVEATVRWHVIPIAILVTLVALGVATALI